MLNDYEQSERDFVEPAETLTTSILCSQLGLTVTPFVFEAHGGGWSKGVSAGLDFIAKHVSVVVGEDLDATKAAYFLASNAGSPTRPLQERSK